jgi:flavin reductase (DIM6/NTAB) family NADH-FMN oxidoreductase RutF
MDPAIKKQALRLFTYGLYVVMCADGAEVNAFTVNWLSQVSFEPPLVVISVENASKSLPMILHSRTCTINVLRSGQRELAGKLGKSALRVPNKLEGVSYEVREGCYPVLHEALAWVACSVQRSIEAGDSTLVIAEVVDAGIITEGQPLTMAEAGFRHAG